MGPGGKPRMVISLPSISQEVKLNKADHAWKPGAKEPTKKADDGTETVDESAVLKKGVLAILNKLCPQKFDILVEKFNQLPIDSQVKMQDCMEFIFEKAVDEPGFSVAYARMCQVHLLSLLLPLLLRSSLPSPSPPPSPPLSSKGGPPSPPFLF